MTRAFAAIACLLLLAAFEPTPDGWWRLTVELDRQYDKIGNRADRHFIKKMINELAASDDAMPTPAQAHWLLSIKTELERRR